MRIRTCALAIATALSLGAGNAAAQSAFPDRAAQGNGDGMDNHLFRPAVDSKGFFAVNGADILGHNDVSLGLVLDYGHGLVPVTAGHGADLLIQHSFQGTLQFDYGIKNFLVLGLSAPVILSAGEQVDDLGPGGTANYTSQGYNAQALGSIALHAKLRLLRPTTDPIGIAIIGQAGFGLGEVRNFAAEPGFWYWPQAVVEKRFGNFNGGGFRVALNGGYRGHTGANPLFSTGKDGKPQLTKGVLEGTNLVTAGFGVSARVLQPLDLVAETYATYQLGGKSDSDQRLSAEALGGIKLFIERNSFLMIGAGTGYVRGFEAADIRGTIGFVFEPSIGDRDGDGIPDDQDDCPDDPEDYDGFQDTKADSPPGQYGCPDPDNDNDGIPDKQDRCPNNPEDRDGDQDADGCPEGNDGDRDGDGILDSHDKCPDVPEDRDGFEDKDGCPDPDNDKDGIPDEKDQCKNDPEDKDGWQDVDGCPDPDNDADGIPDIKEGSDKDGNCMNRPETFNGFQDEDGCPDQGRVVVQENNVLILDKILFKTGSAEILQESLGIVDAVAQTLSHHPEFSLVEVQGHADERADDNYNLKLTQDRANAVVEAVVKRGVDRKTLRAMGYGEYCPLDPAHNAAAWDKNRRVEFKIVKNNGAPTGVTLGCEAAEKKHVKPPAD
jgi:outer membrane protein OmpA-like peptidoglycan-associated protein